jgi:hypothetical protein
MNALDQATEAALAAADRVAVLRAELADAERDLRAANEHVRLLRSKARLAASGRIA